MRILAMGALLLATTACASTGSSSGASRSEITRLEIDDSRGSRTATDVVRRLRPQWLRGRGSGTFNKTAEEGIVIYVDGIRSGMVPVTQTLGNVQSMGPNPLDAISVDRIERILYYTSSEATQRFGTGHAYGAIDVVTRG